MNEKGVEVLVQAAMRGVKQIKNHLSDGQGGMCANGVLISALGRGQLTNPDQWRKYQQEYGISLETDPRTCQLCYRDFQSEAGHIAHLNDYHDMDFLTIARKLGGSNDLG